MQMPHTRARFNPLTVEELSAFERSEVNQLTGRPNSPEYFKYLDKRDQTLPDRRPEVLHKILAHIHRYKHGIFGGSCSTTRISTLVRCILWYNEKNDPSPKRPPPVDSRPGYWDPPRRDNRIMVVVPTRSIAGGLADELRMDLNACGWPMTVLCRMRDGDLPHDSRIIVATEGMSFRAIMDHPSMENFSAVLFLVDDPSPSLEVLMGWSLWLRQNTDTKIRFYFVAPPTDHYALATTYSLPHYTILNLPPPSKHVDFRYPSQPVSSYKRWASEEVIHYLEEGILGDIVIYVTAFREGEDIIKGIQDHPKMVSLGQVECHVIAADSSEDEKNDATVSRRGNHSRRIVCSTHILPLPDVNIVLDLLQARTKVFDPELDRDDLVTVSIASSQSQQRIGGASYVSRAKTEWQWRELVTDKPKPVSRTLTESDHEALIHNLALNQRVKERSEWCKWGRGSAQVLREQLLFTSNQPSPPTRQRALETLRSVGGLIGSDEAFRISKMGKRLADIPVDVEYGRSLIAAIKYDIDVVREIIILCAANSTSKPLLLPRPKISRSEDDAIWARRDELRSDRGDHFDAYACLREYRRQTYQLTDRFQDGPFKLKTFEERLKEEKAIARRLGIKYSAAREGSTISKSLAYRMTLDEGFRLRLRYYSRHELYDLSRDVAESTLVKMQKCLVEGHIAKIAIPVDRSAWVSAWEAKREAGQEASELGEHRAVTHTRERDGSTTLIARPEHTSVDLTQAQALIFSTAERDKSTGLTVIKLLTPFALEF